MLIQNRREDWRKISPREDTGPYCQKLIMTRMMTELSDDSHSLQNLNQVPFVLYDFLGNTATSSSNHAVASPIVTSAI